MSLLSDIGTAIKNKLGGTSVDNTVPRYDGTTCKLKGSGVTISDTNAVTASGGFIGNLTGNASTATLASDSNKLIGKNWLWSGQAGQPIWVWGGSDGTNMYVWNPANFTVANATNTIGYGQTWQNVTASRAVGVTYTNNTGKPIIISIFHTVGATQILVNGYSNGIDQGASNNTSTITERVIPVGATYSVIDTTVTKWSELR